jgi:hypothetical protein
MATTATAHFGPMAVQFQTAQYEPEPRTVAFAAPVRVSEEELVAAVFRCAEVGLAAEDLADLDYVRELVSDQFVNGGLDEINEARVRAGNLTPGSWWHGYLQEIRQAVRLAFAPVLTRPTNPPAPRRELAGVTR